MRMLIVEDESRVANFIHKGLANVGYEADIASDAEEADQFASERNYDLILLDWILPGVSGLELCQRWRHRGMAMPIIMLTARDNTADVIEALDKGADDYIMKPFSFDELLARIRALLRRYSPVSSFTEIKFDDITLDVLRRKVKRGDTEIFLSAREFALLEYLMNRPGKVVSKAEILAEVWGIEFQTRTNLIEVYINHLRNKLDCGSRVPVIHTVKGAGYMLNKLTDES